MSLTARPIPRPGYAATGMMDNCHTVRLEFSSAFEMLDLVQIVSDAVGRMAGLDDEGVHWIGVAIRESVINAIKHGNRSDARKSVFVEFAAGPAAVGGGDPVEERAPAELVVRVRDQGEGFDPSVVGDPLAPENLLKASGRGIFFMRSFMDDLSIRRMPEGGMEVRMVKRLPRG